MSDRFQWITKEERQLFDYLKECPNSTSQYNEIKKALKKHSISGSTVNRMLKDNEGTKVFRVKKGRKIFYKLNDFPKDIQMFFALIDSFKEKDHSFYSLVKDLQNDIILLYPRFDFDQIFEMWKLKMKSISEGDEMIAKIYEKLKDML